ncbi:Nucleoside triphosphate pyrophosphohydrolase MazG [Ochrobactrum soli]|uniref:Nucleoside triphosphate pyrophosphohydrolase n=2 Tax=Ochrobactrum TaxID=528 RepID=A0A2P9HMQ9_9HYPH|nr:Nucleoside triphosphate pyrophosphohydrolase MazG [[Ochrobactrum] soli]
MRSRADYAKSATDFNPFQMILWEQLATVLTKFDGAQMTPSRNIDRLLEIMAALRNPETGCPWDVEQNFRSIMPYTLEEAYEVLDAIERDDMDDLREELGDLLLQVVFHARMAEEQGSFDFGNVVEAITHKMIRRHPHVFGDAEARSAGMAKGSWNRIKAEEKAERAERRANLGLDTSESNGFLDDIPNAFPALVRALKLQQKAAKVGFDWSEAAPILDKISEETAELKEAMAAQDKANIAEEYGDLLFAMVNLGRHLEIDAETALISANEKFKRRFHFIEKTLDEAGNSLDSASLEEMEDIWTEAKKKGL